MWKSGKEHVLVTSIFLWPKQLIKSLMGGKIYFGSHCREHMAERYGGRNVIWSGEQSRNQEHVEYLKRPTTTSVEVILPT